MPEPQARVLLAIRGLLKQLNNRRVVEEQQLSCITTDLLAIEMSEQQLIYFVPMFLLEVRKKIVKNTHLTVCIKWSVGYKGK